MCVLKRQNTPWHQKSKSCGESHLYPSASTICLIRQHLSVQPNNLTPMIGRDPRMTGEISFGAKKIQFKSLGYLLFTGAVTGVLCFFYITCFDRTNFAGEKPEEAEDADEGGWGLRMRTLCQLWLEMGYKGRLVFVHEFVVYWIDSPRAWDVYSFL